MMLSKFSLFTKRSHRAWREKGVGQAVKKFSTKLEENISFVAIHTEELVWTQTVALTLQISKSELSFCHKEKISVWTRLRVICYESFEPLIQTTNTCKVSNLLNFSQTSGLSLWASDISNSLAPCLLSKNISVEHYLGYLFPTLLKWQNMICM